MQSNHIKIYICAPATGSRQQMSNSELLVVKIGGNILDDAAALDVFTSDFAALGGHKILVHGGGKLATELSARLGIATRMAAGRRITDEDTLRVVTMTYAGWVNKTITASLQAKSCPAIGLCGADAGLIPAIKRPVKDIDYGWVGDILSDRLNTGLLNSFFQQQLTPVIAPIASDASGHLLNVNADTIAQSVAVAMSKSHRTTLVYCFEKNGLLMDVNDNSSVIDYINSARAEELKAKGIIAGGMVPKIDNALSAVNSGVQRVVIGHAGHIKQMASNQKGYGTGIGK